MIGKVFGRLTVIAAAGRNKHRKLLWDCLCSCGTSVTAIVGSYLRNGETKSCGCLKREVLALAKTTHGMTGTRLYRIWQSMMTRCYNENRESFKHYGGRGILVCEEWHEFIPFAHWALTNGYQQDLTIDRINNDQSYSPANCQWANYSQQAYNRRQGTQKLSEAEVVNIRLDKRPRRIIAADYSISSAHVGKILRGERRPLERIGKQPR